MTDFNSLQITSVNDLLGYHAKVAFTTKSAEVFKGSEEIPPRHFLTSSLFLPRTRRIKLLDSNEIRQLRDVCVFEINELEVFMWCFGYQI